MWTRKLVISKGGHSHVHRWHFQWKYTTQTQEQTFALYLRGVRIGVSALSLLPAWMLRHVPGSVCFYCVSKCTYSPAGSVNKHTLQLPHSMHSLSRVDSGLPACARARLSVCVWGADLRAECRPKRKSGSCLCPSHRYVSDYHMVPLQLQGHNTSTGT